MMKTWEFRNILIDLNEIEREILALTSTLPDFKSLKKIASIRTKLLNEYKCIESNEMDHKQVKPVPEPSVEKNTQPVLKWCVEVPDDLGGLKTHMFDKKESAESFAKDATRGKGWSDRSPFAYQVTMKYIVE